jgi:hypothetical protein
MHRRCAAYHALGGVAPPTTLDGGMEGWRDGGMEGWRVGGLVGWWVGGL